MNAEGEDVVAGVRTPFNIKVSHSRQTGHLKAACVGPLDPVPHMLSPFANRAHHLDVPNYTSLTACPQLHESHRMLLDRQELAIRLPTVYEELCFYYKKLELHFRDMQVGQIHTSLSGAGHLLRSQPLVQYIGLYLYLCLCLCTKFECLSMTGH